MSLVTRPAFSSARLDMTPVRAAHAQRMVELLSAPELYLYQDGEPPALAYLERQYQLLESGVSPDGSQVWLTWICSLHATQQPIGYIQATIHDHWFSIGYVFGTAFQRQGYAREAVGAMLAVVFAKYPVEFAQAEMDTRNVASWRLAEALGFQRARRVPNVTRIHGDPIDEYEYTLSKADFWGRT
jgi:ribosomal-protein-alanine N-acetyltransferase